MNHYLTTQEAQAIFGYVGQQTQISKDILYVNPHNIAIGDHTRIDAQSVLIAGEQTSSFTIGRYVHLGIGVKIFGSSGTVVVADYVGLSANVTLFTASDDYSEGFMTNPTIPIQYRQIKSGHVILNEHVIIGCNSVVLPGITLGYGASVGALTLVNKSVPDGMIVSGNPLRKIGQRNLQRLQDISNAFITRNHY